MMKVELERYNRLGSLALLALLLCVGQGRAAAADREPPRFELEAQLVGATQRYVGGAGMIGGLVSTGAAAQIGLRLSERVVLLSGLQVAAAGSSAPLDNWSSIQTSVPLELKVYLRRPEARTIVPLLRAGGAWSLVSHQRDGGISYTMHTVEARGAVGLQYFFTERVALGMDLGVIYGRGFFSSEDLDATGGESHSWGLDASWRTGLLLGF